MRYNVERSRGYFDDVGADDMKFLHSGALVFYQEGTFQIAYAPGQWVTVTPGDD